MSFWNTAACLSLLLRSPVKEHRLVCLLCGTSHTTMTTPFSHLAKYTQLSSELQTIEDLYSKRLWYNLTTPLTNLFTQTDISEADLSQLYKAIRNDFALNLNPINLAFMVCALAKKLQDKEQALQLLKETDESIQKNERKVHEACWVLHAEMAETYIALAKYYAASDSEKFEENIKKGKDLLNSVQKRIDQEPYVDNRVSAKYYLARATLLKVLDEPNDFYKTALLYLAYEDMENMATARQQFMAYDIGISALLGDRIYNFGELLGHQVIESLKGSKADWLYQLLFAFNSGDIAKFKQLEREYSKQGDGLVLNRKQTFIAEKIQLMALLELVFRNAPEKRTLTFSEIREATQSSDVELLLLKALALNLIKGTIDEVAQSTYIQWSQPRVLDRSQLGNLKEKVDSWKARVADLNQIQNQKAQ
mmetsp:Transcript_3882/g.14661  ORF Transcript_3882/g.14661 Transcript_3882/m.14661 type:complete len:421 (-) Transcript_3882:6726-7988(-)